MVIVSVTRPDLRDEFAMADEAFALSPISARAAMPSEADYDAIREAFMETSRGRWFLGEYAKRNRNADTSMVLDAVARIEETLAAQQQPEIEDRVPQVLAAIRSAVERTEAAAGAALDPAVLEERLGPIHRGIRIIKEISWRWREIGADGRICDLIDSQLAVIEGACGQISAIDPRAELKVAFDLLRQRVEQAGISEDAAPQAATSAHLSPASTDEAPAEVAEAPLEIVAPEVAEVAVGVTDVMDVTDVADMTERRGLIDELDPAIATEPANETSPEAAAAEAEDEAVLEMVALEMAAPDPEFDGEFDAPPSVAAEPAAALASEQDVAGEPQHQAVGKPAEIAAAWVESPGTATAPARPSPESVSSPQSAPQPSLGATILASGILQAQRAPAHDPLAPIRRMTQAEKIAFFS
jgi:hypothetical protein